MARAKPPLTRRVKKVVKPKVPVKKAPSVKNLLLCLRRLNEAQARVLDMLDAAPRTVKGTKVQTTHKLLYSVHSIGVGDSCEFCEGLGS